MAYHITRDWEIDAGFDFGPNSDWLSRFTFSKDPHIPPLDSEPLTVFLQGHRRRATPPDVVGWARAFVASKATTATIERLESSIHDFVPCEAYYMSGSKYSKYEYLVVRLNSFLRDVVDMDRCDCTIVVKPDGTRVWAKKSGKPLALKASAIEGRHIFYHGGLFCSDEFHDALKEAGLGVGWAFERHVVV